MPKKLKYTVCTHPLHDSMDDVMVVEATILARRDRMVTLKTRQFGFVPGQLFQGETFIMTAISYKFADRVECPVVLRSSRIDGTTFTTFSWPDYLPRPKFGQGVCFTAKVKLRRITPAETSPWPAQN